jgi:signal transduction histidine kinase
LIHPDDRARIGRPENHLMRAPFSKNIESRGKGAYVNVAISDSNRINGIPIRLIGAASNITQKTSRQMKADFVSFVTHQLRTPLRA